MKLGRKCFQPCVCLFTGGPKIQGLSPGPFPFCTKPCPPIQSPAPPSVQDPGPHTPADMFKLVKIKQQPLSTKHVQTWTSLYRKPFLVVTFSNLFIMKYIQSASRQLISYWNAFLLLICVKNLR